jgi:pimeloyl-ACP methyl ester carboxylesterase
MPYANHVARRLLALCLVVAAEYGNASDLAARGGAPLETALAAPAARVESATPCFVAPPQDLEFGAAYDCGYVVVPEDASKPGGRTVKLGFLRVRGRAGKPSAPLFMLAGGPGSTLISPLTFALLSPDFLGPILDTRDVVVLEQRGSIHSVPVLDCPQANSLAWTVYRRKLGEQDSIALERETLARCIGDFRRQGIDLARYNSVAIAADINAAREALDYRQIVYYGASYGSQLGQHVMRDFPEMLEAVILDGAESLSRKSWIENRALDTDYALRHLAGLCEADPKCREAYDIGSLVDRGLALFDEGPIAASFADPENPGTVLRFDVRRDDFVAFVYEMQGSKIGVMSLPSVLHDLVKDGRKSMGEVMGSVIGQALIGARNAPAGAMAQIMHMAVVCSDDPVRSADELVLDGVGRYARLFGESVAREYVRLCEIAGVPDLPDSTDVDVKSDLPTLILSGGLDAQTPTFRSEIVARALPNARLVVFPDSTHVQLGAINFCAAKIVVAFVDDPSAKLPLECVGDLRFPGFILPDGSASRETTPR